MKHRFFEKDLSIIAASLESVPADTFEDLIADVCATLQAGGKVIITGVGKNYPICVKAADTLKSVGLQAYPLHAYEALHGSLGMVAEGDLIITISKSGQTKELVTLVQALQDKKCLCYLISFARESTLSQLISHQIIMDLEHEGDLWNLLPNNSTASTLILLQTLVTEVTGRLKPDKHRDFLANHPGGSIGQMWSK